MEEIEEIEEIIEIEEIEEILEHWEWKAWWKVNQKATVERKRKKKRLCFSRGVNVRERERR